MNSKSNLIIKHYSKLGLFNSIIKALKGSGTDIANITLDDLKAFDEFHVGGIQATLDLLYQLKINSKTKVLDMGAGLGGVARHIASKYNANVIGIDLTPDFIETANKLNKIIGLNVKFQVGNVLDMPFADNRFDLAILIHVGMNLSNKSQLFKEAARVLVSNGSFAIYDIMKIGSGSISFPTPWASEHSSSFVDTVDNYNTFADSAGFTLKSKRIRTDFALNFFKSLTKPVKKKRGFPLVGANLVMGADTKIKINNLFKAIKKKHLSPVEIIFEKK